MRTRVTALIVLLALLVPALSVARGRMPCNLPVLLTACCCSQDTSPDPDSPESRVSPVCCCELRNAPSHIESPGPALLSQKSQSSDALAPARAIAMPVTPRFPALWMPGSRLGARAPPLPAGGLPLFAHHYTSLLV